MRVVRTIEVSTAVSGDRDFDLRGVGATGLIYEGIKEVATTLSVVGSDLAGVFNLQLLSSVKQAAGGTAQGSTWGMLYPGAGVRFTVNSLGGQTQVYRVHLVVEMERSFGQVCLREWNSGLGAAGFAGLLPFFPIGNQVRSLRAVHSGDRACHLVEISGAFVDLATVNRGAIVGAAGGGADTGWWPAVNFTDLAIQNDDAVNAMTSKGHVMGSLEVV
jgi:hypothetical protein